ncbi:hypothetical protein J8273_6464 [Carpediemonas membranifera]|uniref:Uncharacterized protein n=1 Tax=Carpediemonas membranifera TaxID=201153 RepID=A0A8J6E055_9EUKA|nr:hypothetical protein J8273_6464 [Carpediemonas membranifera]|eukprot:KAG9391688.1 hypothetical protein J8273_6464 [Carpediemonas membranifera]
MGNVVSQDGFMRRYILEEYERQVETAESINVAELMLMESPDHVKIDWKHWGILYCLDEDRDGRFELHNFFNLVEYYNIVSEEFNQRNAIPFVQACCSLLMWKSLVSSGGREHFVDWFSRLFVQIGGVESFADVPGVAFLPPSTVHHMFDILDIEDAFGIDYESFFRQCQTVGEEAGLIPLCVEEIDEHVPVLVAKQLALHMINGFINLAAEVEVGSTGIPDYPTTYAVGDIPLPKPRVLALNLTEKAEETRQQKLNMSGSFNMSATFSTSMRSQASTAAPSAPSVSRRRSMAETTPQRAKPSPSTGGRRPSLHVSPKPSPAAFTPEKKPAPKRRPSVARAAVPMLPVSSVVVPEGSSLPLPSPQRRPPNTDTGSRRTRDSTLAQPLERRPATRASRHASTRMTGVDFGPVRRANTVMGFRSGVPVIPEQHALTTSSAASLAARMAESAGQGAGSKIPRATPAKFRPGFIGNATAKFTELSLG